MAGLALLLVTLEWFLGRRERRRDAALSWTMFHRVARDRELSPAETARLREWAGHAHLERPQEVLLFAETFERFASSTVAELPPREGPSGGDGRGNGAREETLSALRDIRQKLGFHPLQTGRRLLSSRQLEAGLQVSVRGGNEGSPLRGSYRVVGVDDETLLLRPLHLVTDPERPAYGADSIGREGAEEDQASPISGQYPMDELRDSEVWVIFWRGLDAIYRFRASVALRDSPRRGDLRLTHGSKLIRVQHRRDPRVDVRMDVRLALADASELAGNTINLSVGGTSILADASVSKGQRLEIHFESELRPLLMAEAEVVQLGRVVGEGEGRRHYLHCRFLNLLTEDREALGSWLADRG